MLRRQAPPSWASQAAWGSNTGVAAILDSWLCIWHARAACALSQHRAARSRVCVHKHAFCLPCRLLRRLAADVTGDRVFVDSLPLPTRQLFAAYGALQQAAAAAPLVAAAAGPARPAPPAWLVVAHAAVPDRKVGALLGAWQARAILSGTVIRVRKQGLRGCATLFCGTTGRRRAGRGCSRGGCSCRCAASHSPP